jgi:hypothetical protein
MTDIFIGLVFVVMVLAPAVIASKQWSSYVTAETESASENGGVRGIAGDET